MLEAKHGITSTPPVWRSNIFQLLSWFFVAALSIFPAFVIVTLLSQFLPELLADFFFGATLVIRWMCSAAIGGFLLEREGIFKAGASAEFPTTEALQTRAVQGDAEAQYNLGLLYQEGWGVPQDLSEAAKWYQKAAEQGLVDAMVLLAGMYTLGLGVPSNEREAVYLLTKAAEKGDATAQYNLGLRYPLPSDSAISLKWFHKAAEQGYAKAYDHLGFSYQVGHGIPQDYVEAFKWYLLASLEGEEADFMMLGVSLRDRMKGLKSQMTQEQIAEAQKLAYEWKPKK